MPVPRSLRAAGLAVVTACCLPATAALPAAAAPPVRCGATLTSSTTLAADLTCRGDGLTLAPGVRLDLGGHRLRGDGTGVGVRALESTGTTVRNGTVERFASGIHFEGATPYPDQSLVLDRLTLVDAPVYLQAAVTTVDRSRFTRSELRLYENFFTARTSVLESSPTVGELNQVRLEHSTVRGGGVGVDENNVVTIEDSTMDGAGSAREAVGCSQGITIVRSVIRNYAYPMWVNRECATFVDASTFVDNPGGAFVTSDSSDNGLVVSRSTFSGGPFGIQGGGGVQVSGSTFSRNEAGMNLTDGMGVTVVSSVFLRNTDDGLAVGTAGARIGGNRADRNGGHGIDAPGAVDLGANRARGNGDTDCVGVSCRP